MSFTITQQPDSANLFLYPNGDDTAELGVSGVTNHYEAVNDIWHSPNNDVDYVYGSSNSYELSYAYPYKDILTQWDSTLDNHYSAVFALDSDYISTDTTGYDDRFGFNVSPYSDDAIVYVRYQIYARKNENSGVAKINLYVENPVNNTYSQCTTITITAYGTSYTDCGLYTYTKYLSPSGSPFFDEEGDEIRWGIELDDSSTTAAYVHCMRCVVKRHTKKTDIYTLENHTNETGEINYVRIFSYGKTVASKNGNSLLYQHYLNDGSTTTFFSLIPTQSYSKFYSTTTLTQSGATWTWADVDNMKIGLRLRSSANVVSTSTYFRPSSPGAYSQFTAVGDSPNYACVNEEVRDDSDYVKHLYGGYPFYDTYNIDSFSHYSNIDSVTLYLYAWDTSGSGTFDYCGVLYNGTTFATGTTQNTGSGPKYTSDTWTTNPFTGNPWHWSDLDNLQIGVKEISTDASDGAIRVSHVYLKVNYSYTKINDVSVTQEYAVVNYTPPESSVTLTGPETLSMSHSRNVTRFLFPNNDYEVEDMGRAGKTLTLSGYELTNGFDKMSTIKDMIHYGSTVSVTGLPDSNLNSIYLIKDFSFVDETGTAGEKYRWNLVLEEAV